MNNSPQPAAKGFTRAFYVSNTVELFERMAYYAVFIVLTIYLSTILGFNDFEASMISGLFSGKSYNLDSLTVGTTEDPTVSRMTIATVSDDETFEQIKKQLNRMVEVIKVIDFTDVFVRMKEILYIKVKKCTAADKVELFQIAETFKARVIDYGKDSLLLEFVQTATKNDAVIKLIKEEFKNIEVVRGGSVGIESISMMER